MSDNTAWEAKAQLLTARVERLEADNARLRIEVNKAEFARKCFEGSNEKLEADNARLRAALQEIADLRYSNTSAATIAQTVLKTAAGG